MTVAFATCAAVPHITDDDLLLVAALAELGVPAEGAVWNDPSIDWRRYASVVIRSTWDYHLGVSAFLTWLDMLEQASVPVCNAPALVRWNAEKTYLRDLDRRGVQIVPTFWVERGVTTRLDALLAERDWDAAVVKPAISASAHETWRTSRATASADEATFRAMVGRGRVLVQPFLDVVREDGEWSLLFYGGEYSHAVLKRPRAGDFRVQKEHGGTSVPAEPSSNVIDGARRALEASERGRASSDYARVDGCVIEGRFVLMEIELIEPDLFLRFHPDAPARLARVVVDAVAAHTIGSRRR